MEELRDRLPGLRTVLRVALVAFVLAWLFGPYALQSAVPIWLPFLIALGLELHFFAGSARPARARRQERGPQAVDRDRYGYADDPGELLLVREHGEELWIPYSGETGDELEALIAEARERPDDEAEAPAAAAVVERGRLRPRWHNLVAGLGLIGALALILWFAESRGGWDELDASTRAAAATRFSFEASRIAGKQVTIRCDESGEHVGVVQHADGVAAVGGDLAFLTPRVCLDLYRLAYKDQVRWSQTARAIAVLAHESWHLRGVGDEATTECYALQAGVDLGRRLGLSENTAARMMQQQVTENALRIGAGAEYRLPAECRDGGRLDLAPDTARFP